MVASCGVGLSLENVTFKGHVDEVSGRGIGLGIYDAFAELRNIIFEGNDIDIKAVGGAYGIWADEVTKNREPVTEPAELFD